MQWLLKRATEDMKGRFMAAHSKEEAERMEESDVVTC
jgi:hypothetical protein